MFVEILLCFGIIACFSYKWFKAKANYFIDRNVQYDKYFPLYAILEAIVIKKSSILDLIIDKYKQFDGEP